MTKERDRIILSPGGEYKRVTNLKNRNKMKKTIIMMVVCALLHRKGMRTVGGVSDPGNLAQGIINTTKKIVQTSTTAQEHDKRIFRKRKRFTNKVKNITIALKSVHNLVKGPVSR